MGRKTGLKVYRRRKYVGRVVHYRLVRGVVRELLRGGEGGVCVWGGGESVGSPQSGG